ncbi:MAG: sensor histidine kinase, partial [Planctomycetota bacterium]
VFAVGMIVSWALAVYGSERVERLVEPARSLARGNLSGPIPARGSDELARLARSLERIRRRWRRQVRRLERERRTLAALLEQLREGVVAADADGHLVLVNPAACRLLDLSPSRSPRDLEGRLVEEYIPHRAVQDLLRPHEPSDDFPTEEGTPEDRQRETASRHPAECQVRIGERTLRIRAGDIELPADEDADGLRPGRVILIADVSERARAERMKTDFAANASHELRTPLSAIRAAVETLRSSCPANVDGAFVRCVEIIERHAARMEALVEDLLDLSKLETPGMRWSRSDVSLPRLLDDIRRQYAEAIEEKRLRWDVQIEPAAKTISANAELLRMVLRNLADNAIKFTEPGGRVTVRAENEPDAVRIVVEDDGCGIPPRERERVFERFYQVERSRSGHERGTGLGLSIVRHATLALGGRVSLESEPGEGTRVTVRLPRSRTD